MIHYFSRQNMLWGKNKQDKLSKKSVLIVGSGGLGCSIALALSGSGIGEIDIIDFDKIEIHNIHRQILFSIDEVGEYKAKIATQKILKRNPYLKSYYFLESFEEFVKGNSKTYDLIIDATDNLKAREEIDNFSKQNLIPWIYGSVEEFNGQVCFFEKSNFNIFAKKEIKTKGVATPIVMQIASFQSNLALRYFLDLPILKDTLYYLYYDKNGDFVIKKFNLPKD